MTRDSRLIAHDRSGGMAVGGISFEKMFRMRRNTAFGSDAVSFGGLSSYVTRVNIF